MVSLNNRMIEYQKQAMMRSMLAPILKYYTFEMERNLALAPVKAWILRRRAFWVGERLVPFSVFDVALMTRMPATGEPVNFDEELVTTEIKDLVRERVYEVEQQELRRRKVQAGTKENRVCKNFIAAMVYLCERYAGEEHLDYGRRCMRGLYLVGCSSLGVCMQQRGRWSAMRMMLQE